jgi:hypothetical protein
MEHRPAFPETDRCVCGGVVVSFDDGDANGEHGEGCEVSDRVFAHHVDCDNCGGRHVAEESHQGVHGEGTIYAVVCTVDHLADYYTAERLI